MSLFNTQPTTWATMGDFKKNHGKNNNMIHQKNYTCDNDENIIKDICLIEQKDFTKQIIILFKHYDVCEKFQTQCLMLGFDIKVNRYGKKFKLCFEQAHDVNICYNFLDILTEFDESVKIIIEDICNTLEIYPSLGLNVQSLSKMSISDACHKVIKAQDFGNNLLIFELSVFYFVDIQIKKEHSIIDPHELCYLLNHVKLENIYYSQLQKMKENVSILVEEDKISQEEKYKNTQQLFIDALYGPDQVSKDCLFSELCGNSDGNLFIENINLDTDTLLSLAVKIKELQSV
jgi:hypothetical protein